MEGNPDTQLVELELLEVSLVNAGDDPLAKVSVFKNKEELMTDNVTDEEVKPARKSYKAEAEALGEANEALLEEVDALKAKVDVLEKALDEAKKAPTEKAKVEEEMIEVAGELVAKSAIPVPVLKQLEDFQKAQEKVALEKKAEELIPNVPGDLAKRVKIVKALGDTDEEMLEFLRSVDAVFAGLFEEVGKGKATEFESPEEELDDMIQKYMDDNSVERAKAYVEVGKSGRGRELVKKLKTKEPK